MSEYWTPSGTAFVASATAQAIASVSGQIDGLALITNLGTTAGFVAVVSASATIGQSGWDLIPIDGNATLFVAFGGKGSHIVATAASVINVNPGYALK